jgi:hypothetical protein
LRGEKQDPDLLLPRPPMFALAVTVAPAAARRTV